MEPAAIIGTSLLGGLEILIVILVIIRLDGVLGRSLGEVDHFSTGATADDVVEVDLLEIVFLLGCLLEERERLVSIGQTN